MRVLNVNSSLDFKAGGGTAERTFQMSRFLAREGVECTVLTIDTGLNDARVLALKPAKVVAIPLLWRRFYVPRISWRTIKTLVDDADVIHLMGHWGVLNALTYWAIRWAGKPYVVCPAGALPIFGRSSLLKRFYNALVGAAIIRNASAWIAVTEAEMQHFEAYGVPSSRVTVIPNGVCAEDFPETDSLAGQAQLGEGPIILFMGRLNLIKGPDLLLDAFIRIAGQLPNYQLVFAGPDGGMMTELKALAERHALSDRVHFLGHVEGVKKSAIYHRAVLLVVSSRQEAMSIVALEAGICGTPALLTNQCGFSEIRSIDPRLEVSASAEALAAGMVSLLADSAVLESIAPKWKRFVMTKYAWEVVVPRYLILYRDLLGRKLRS
ncbi:glycosyltransferase [Polaromonas jejuensis]|uniref:Glycosyltransferase n=1 Tax=Polaromonas jejuensis TaxID=457502 RepID=A0ABW0QCZ5_9BURK|nr:glycosyltransferase [Polaromonas jejuensis]